MEQVSPGYVLWEVEDYRERAKIFVKLLKDLPIIWDGNGNYPTYRTWMEELRVKLINLGDREDIIFYLDKALEIYDELKRTYSRKYLLHGDLHHENMLSDSSGGYKIIDPKGVIDDPVMETARYLLNESSLEADEILEIINIISSATDIPKRDVTKSMYIDAALSQGWTFDKPFADPNKFAEEKQEALDFCAFVYGLL
jgi:streptomycin 6-kinase